jgi:hypothetical protein
LTHVKKFVKKGLKKINNDIKLNNLNKYNVEQNDSDFEINQLNIYELQKQLTLLYNELEIKINYYNNVN